ncbi:hypothetical protein HB904_09405 [Listeria booriae]|uniref:Uncharacterized protein n=1 Tax=Listeria booriae TaxID=1552123 RepID=A0A842AJQ8_9LIST|nr:hypothetical protein [Listeria booriae]MBC1616405.1 hypothetical protein [Listeria booriae]
MKKLAKLITENPDLKVVTVTERKDDEYSSYAAGDVRDAYIDYMYIRTVGADDILFEHREDRPYFKSIDRDEALEQLNDRISYRENTLDEAYLKQQAERAWDGLAWEKVILVYAVRLEESKL